MTLTFHMGKYEVVLPSELRYARNHMWAREESPGLWRFGFSSYAIRLMQDVYFLEWSIDAGDAVRVSQDIGHIETSKAESDLFSPLLGTLTRFNEDLLKDPSAINADGYGAGWLFEIATQDASPLMEADSYHHYLSSTWENTQRLIKGKINTED
jgi:glycine cleavage system H protein